MRAISSSFPRRVPNFGLLQPAKSIAVDGELLVLRGLRSTTRHASPGWICSAASARALSVSLGQIQPFSRYGTPGFLCRLTQQLASFFSKALT